MQAFSLLSLGRDTATSYPELSSKYKAVEVKTITFYVSHVCSVKCNDSEDSRLRAVLMWSVCQYMHVLDQAGLILRRSEIQDAQEHLQTHLLASQKLCGRALSARRWLWRLRPKCHYQEHGRIALETGINPRYLANFAEEDLIGVMKRIGCKVNPATFSTRLLQRYLVYMTLRWRVRNETGKCQLPTKGLWAVRT